MSQAEIENRVQILAEESAREFLSECLRVRFRHRGKVTIVDVVADKPSGGISVDECARINKHLNALIEQEGFWGEDYSVEVSSPGLDWPMTSGPDLRRVINRDVRFHLTEPVDGKLEYSGKVVSVDEAQTVIKTSKGTVMIPLSSLNKAFQIIT